MTRSEEALKTFVGIKRTNDRLNKAVKVDVKNYGLNVNEFTVLEVLFHRGKLQVQQIKELILIANSSTTYIIDKLCQKKLVKRVQDKIDRRITYVDLTDEGYQLMKESFPKHEQTILSLFDRLDDEELVEMKRLLKKMNGYT
jgi:MarR family 2-MHQ and catechol resistance regulon transcriptional repressor